MKQLMKLSLVVMLAIGLSLTSCKKNDKEDMELTSAEDQSQGESNYDQVFKEVDDAASETGLKKGGFPIILIDTNNSIRTMTINYGPSNYLCKDGNYRRGIINVTWTGKYRAAGTVITIGFTEFYQNDNHIEGSKTITNNGRNALNQMKFTIIVNGKVTTVTNETHIWNSNRTRTWISGESTPIWNDDVYEISGTTSGTNRKGISYSAVTTVPIKADLSCQYRFVSGVIELTPEGKAKRIIDFGTGKCDNQVTVTINGKSHIITKKR
ncbi:MAG: hypothetical protein Q8M15_11520 [Bacteroidota bacterium]|nr:hypothetical protein [Bacteroidota bacterium]